MCSTPSVCWLKKSLLGILFLWFSMIGYSQPRDFVQKINTFLQQYNKEGLVDYAAIASSDLKELTQIIATTSYQELPEAAQKAFLINAYNILVIQAVKEQYPIASPQEGTGFFTLKTYTVGGETLTLDDLEKEVLLKRFNDPRLHFVLVCAAKGCPPLSSKAYRAADLEQQLEHQTRLALNDSKFVFVRTTGQSVYVSEIFRWYANDFKVVGGIKSFINSYRSSSIPEDFKIKYYEYNWQLNDANPVKRSGNPRFFRAARLLGPRQFELKIFNSLYTQQQYDGFEQLNSRSSFFSSFFQYLHGNKKPFNLGFDVVVRSHIINDLASNSPFKAIQNSSFDEMRTMEEGRLLQDIDGRVLTTSGRFGFSHIGPKIRIHPFKKNRNISFQQTLYLPITKEVDGQTIAFSQLFYDKLVGTQSQLFVEASLWTPIRPTFRIDPFLKVFYSYFPTSKWTVYGMVGLPNELGIGTKYLVAKNVEIELLYTNYLIQRVAVKDRIAQTFNFGIRVMR